LAGAVPADGFPSKVIFIFGHIYVQTQKLEGPCRGLAFFTGFNTVVSFHVHTKSLFVSHKNSSTPAKKVSSNRKALSATVSTPYNQSQQESSHNKHFNKHHPSLVTFSSSLFPIRYENMNDNRRTRSSK